MEVFPSITMVCEILAEQRVASSKNMVTTDDNPRLVGECKHIISGYLKCIKSKQGTNDEACRRLAKDYLACRMDKYVAPMHEYFPLRKG